MILVNIILELAVVAVCIHTGFSVGRPARDAVTEARLRSLLGPYLALWAVITIIGAVGSFINFPVFFTMFVIGVGLAIGFAAGRQASPK